MTSGLTSTIHTAQHVVKVEFSVDKSLQFPASLALANSLSERALAAVLV
jgi:hypothetical protein